MENNEKNNAQKKMEEGLQELSNLPAEDRVDIYERLSRRRGWSNLINMPLTHFRNFRRENIEISEGGFVVTRKPRVFLSHSHSDKRLARRIYEYLDSEGIKVWLDEAELRFGDSLISKLRIAIDSVDILLALISINSINSEWVNKEIEIAMNQEIDSKRVKVIPLLCDPVELPGFLVGKFYADFLTSDSRKKNLPKLVLDIKGHIEDEKG